MNRYAFYAFWSNAITVAGTFLYNYLLEERFNGSLMAIAISSVSGMILTITMMKSLEHFPRQGLPEIFRMFLPAWARVPFLIFLSVMLVTKGCIVIGFVSNFYNLYLLTDMNITMIIAFMFLVASWGATRSSKTFLSTLEMVIFFSAPIIYYVFTEAIFSHKIEWNSIKAMSDYAFVWPKWEMITAINGVYSGFVGMIIFNRIVPSKINWKFAILILIVTLHLLIIGLLISIGIHGTYGVGNYISPTYSALDSIGILSGIFNRTIMAYFLIVLFFFLMYASITLHGGLELLKGCFSIKFQNNPRKVQLFSWTICCLTAIGTMFYYNIYTQKQIVHNSIHWLGVRFYTETLMVALVAWFVVMKRRRKA